MRGTFPAARPPGPRGGPAAPGVDEPAGRQARRPPTKQTLLPAYESRVVIGLSRKKPDSLAHALAPAHRIFAADRRPALVDRAPQGISIQSRAPAVVETTHHPSAPAILDGQWHRDVVVAHQQDFQPATARRTGGARDPLAAVHVVAIASGLHARHCPMQQGIGSTSGLARIAVRAPTVYHRRSFGHFGAPACDAAR